MQKCEYNYPACKELKHLVFYFAGFYCVDSTVLVPVKEGTPCPIGTYGNREGLKQESDCTSCDAGRYCDTEGKFYIS